MTKPLRPCPACRPGIQRLGSFMFPAAPFDPDTFCSACGGRGHSPKVQIVIPPGFGGDWEARPPFGYARPTGDRQRALLRRLLRGTGETAFIRYWSPLFPTEPDFVPGPGGEEVSATYRRKRPAEQRAEAERGFLSSGGWHAVSIKQGSGGLTSHRGVLQGDEFVDSVALIAEAEAELGFTRAEYERVARPGKPRKADQEVSLRVNARLAQLRAEGANMTILAAILGTTRQALIQRAKRFALRPKAEESGLRRRHGAATSAGSGASNSAPTF